MGHRPAIFVSSLLFVVLHWLNAGVWGNMVQMALVFAFTFAMGFVAGLCVCSFVFDAASLAIHLGWNWMQNYVFR